MLVLNNDFAIDNGGAAVELSGSFDYALVALSPIEAIAGIGVCLTALDDEEGPVAIVLDFVNPSSTRRWMIDRGCELRIDEPQRHIIDLAEPDEIASHQRQAA